MEPPVRPLLGAFEIDGIVFVTAEIPGLDISRRPCFYKGKGRIIKMTSGLLTEHLHQ